MQVTIKTTAQFDSWAKMLCKKYRSLSVDIKKLKEELLQNPLMGTDLGNGIHKIRLAIKSKNKGKSGGARVITKVEIIVIDNDFDVTLVAIYDKSELGNITKQEILKILQQA